MGDSKNIKRELEERRCRVKFFESLPNALDPDMDLEPLQLQHIERMEEIRRRYEGDTQV